jgi:hypothetical protein
MQIDLGEALPSQSQRTCSPQNVTNSLSEISGLLTAMSDAPNDLQLSARLNQMRFRDNAEEAVLKMPGIGSWQVSQLPVCGPIEAKQMLAMTQPKLK